MNDHQVVSLIALGGFLILVLGSFSAREIGLQRGLRLAGIWAGIFALVILFIDLAR